MSATLSLFACVRVGVRVRVRVGPDWHGVVWLRRCHPLLTLPLVSSYLVVVVPHAPSVHCWCRSVGFCGCLAKPFAADQLRTALTNAVTSAAWFVCA